MKLIEYFEREPSGMAFVDVVVWLSRRKQNSSPVLPSELQNKQREYILRHGGNSEGIGEEKKHEDISL